jgi:N-acetylneuraminic acid mutarotase
MPRGGWGASAAPRSNVRRAAPAHPSNQWTTSDPLNQPRATHGGAECSGAIFVLGGWPDLNFSRALTEVEYLDQFGDPWKKRPPLNQGRGNPAAAALNDRLYAIGGYPTQPGALTSVEVLECRKGTAWSYVRPLPDPNGRGSGAAAAAGDRIYVTGGDDGTTAPSLGTLLIYDPKTDQWDTGRPMLTARSNLKLVHLGRYIYAIGGIANGKPPGSQAPTGPALNTVERYDPGQNQWAPVASMITPRVNVATAVVGDQIVVIGGADGPDFDHLHPLETIEVYSRANDEWTQFDPPLNQARSGMTSARVQGTAVLAIGGVFSTGQGFVVTQEVDLGPKVQQVQHSH